MRKIRAWILRFGGLFNRQRKNRELDDEIESHLQMHIEDNLRLGMTPEEARREAMIKLGGIESTKEAYRDQRGLPALEMLWQDIRYGARMLRKNPGFTAVAVLTLALGIGTSTAIFTLMNAIMLRALPVPNPSQLVLPRKVPGDVYFSYPLYEHLRDRMQSLSGLAATQNSAPKREILASGFGATERERVRAQAVSGNFFSVVGASAVLGRTLLAEDDRADQPESAVVLSHAYWLRRFGGDPAVLGKSILIGGPPFTIVGVMAPRFSGFTTGIEPDLWLPMQMLRQLESGESPSRLDNAGWEWMLMVGRLKPDVTRERAEAELRVLYRQELADLIAIRASGFSEKQRQEYLNRTGELDSGRSGYTPLRQRFKQPLVILTAVVSIMLLIACANVAGLLLERGAQRQREFAVRTALGAGRGRLARQLVTESVVLACLGGALGLLFARLGADFLAAYLPAQHSAFFGLDQNVLLFALTTSLLTGIICGLVTAFCGSRAGFAAALKNQAVTVVGPQSRINHALVVLQIAMSVTLLAGAGLFVRTLNNLLAIDLGFQRENVVVFKFEFAREYSSSERAELYRQLLQALEAVPDGRNATFASGGLFSSQNLTTQFSVDGYTAATDEEIRGRFFVVGPRFFETLGIPLVRGRGLTDRATAMVPGDAASREVVVSESLAHRFFGDANPIGHTLRHRERLPFEIVGVARDTKYGSVHEQSPLEYYVPFSYEPIYLMSFYVRTTRPPTAFAANVRAIVHQVDPKLLGTEVRVLEDLVNGTLARERILAQLTGFFSIFALLLASLGLYGALSYAVTRRTREIGLRMALGATVSSVLGLVARRGLSLALLGCLLGLGGAFVLTRLVANLLYNVSPSDPLTFTVAAAVLLAVALLACWLPARRAAKVDPIVALRYE